MRTSISLVPLIGVLVVLFTLVAQDFAMVEIHVPRKLDGTCCGCGERVAKVRVDLHADSSAELDVHGQRSYVDAPQLSTAVRTAIDAEVERVEAIHLNPDDNTSWQQVVEATSALAHASGLKVALVTTEP